MANLSNINNKFLVTTTGEVLIGQTANNGNRLQITGADGASYIYLKTDVATTGGRIGFNSDDLRVFNQQAGGDLSFGTVGTERMKIDQFGQIFSFGQIRLELAATETNPIVGTNCSFLFQNTSNTDGNLAVVDFRNSTGFVTGRIGAQFQDAGDRNTDLFFMTRANGGNLTERMRITSNGNTTFVKGTDSDRAANSIKHAANSFLYIKGGAAGVSLNDDGEDTRIILFNNSNIRFDAGTKDNAMNIQGNTGHVGIGTDSPSTVLQVQLDTQNESFSARNGTDFLWLMRNEAGAGARQSGRFQMMDTDVTTVNIESASNRNTYFNAGNVLVGATGADIGGSNTGIRFNQSGSILASIDETTASSFVAYFDRRGTNNQGTVIGLAMQGFFKASIGVIGTSANTNDGGITFNTLATSGGFSKAERMRITSAGEILIRRTADYDSSNIHLLQVGDASIDNHIPIVTTVASTATRTHIIFSNFNSNNVGEINTGGSSTTYNTSSDYRLKEDLQDFAGLDMVSKIPVYDFKWKADESRSYGVMAHELQKVLPQAVSGKKDNINDKGKIKPQQVDYSKIVPLLVKSIQELKAEIELLKNK